MNSSRLHGACGADAEESQASGPRTVPVRSASVAGYMQRINTAVGIRSGPLRTGTVRGPFLACLLLTLCLDVFAADSSLTLWYTQPATKWTEALPIGNGRLGGM